MIIYIAGPITGLLRYRETFDMAERYLKNLGHIVINPSMLPPALKDYMPICKAMIDQADTVYFLNGWEESVGAKEEYEYATEHNKRIIMESLDI